MSRRGAAAKPKEEDAGPGGDENAQDNAPRRAGSVGRSLELEVPADIAMENIVEKLKMLDYEKDFCKQKRPPWPPLSKTYFAYPPPSNNQNEQFFCFTSLSAWLLGLAGRNFQAPAQFEDPNAACSNIIMELKDAGFATPNFPPAKLKQGHGDAVCGVLDNLLDLVLERHITQWRRPFYQPDNYPEDADIEDESAGMDGQKETGDIPDVSAEDEDEEEEAYMVGGRGPEKTAEEIEDTKAIESQVDSAEWKLELERVAPQLRVMVAADNKDWRAHLESAHQHQEQIAKTFPDVKVLLEHVAADVGGALEKISTREKFINAQLEPLTQQYQVQREQLNGVQERYNKSTEAVADLTNELARVSEELEKVKGTMAERGDNIADTSPLVKIKSAIAQLKNEVKTMEVRIGVVRNTLLQVNLKHKGSPQRRFKSSLHADFEDDEEDFA